MPVKLSMKKDAKKRPLMESRKPAFYKPFRKSPGKPPGLLDHTSVWRKMGIMAIGSTVNVHQTNIKHVRPHSTHWTLRGVK